MALITLSIGAIAQTKAVRIESPLVSEKDFVWYTEQKEAWKALTQKDPTNETAWLNYYNAARYMSWFQQEDSTAKQVVREMEQTIPNSYTFNFCAYRESVQGKGYGDHKKYAEAALAKLPDEMRFFDYDNWVCYLAMQGDEARMKPLAKRGMGIHKNKTIICASFLAVKEYRDWLCTKLGVVDPIHEEPYWTDESCNALLQAIIDKYGSKVYFTTTTPSSTMEPWKNNLYNEGLLLKYSKKPYDNLAVKRRNVEERYMLEYLLVSFRPEWTAGQRLSANYAVLLADLLPYYAKHDQKRYDWLMKLLVSGVTNTSLDEDHKQSILKQLM